MRTINRLRRSLKREKRKNRILLRKIKNAEYITTFEAFDCKDILDFLAYRKCFLKRAEEYYHVCTGMKNWVSKQMKAAETLLVDDALHTFTHAFSELSLLIDNMLDEFQDIKPEPDEDYDFVKHELAVPADPSEDLKIKEVLHNGCTLDGRVIRKAKVIVYSKK